MTADLQKRLLQDVVIFPGKDAARTGAQAEAPDHTPRRKASAGPLPPRSAIGAAAGASLQQQVEQFLFLQSELLDGKHWAAFIDLFADDGVYWMPVKPEQTEWLDSPSIFAEDRNMMEIRAGRVSHPN